MKRCLLAVVLGAFAFALVATPCLAHQGNTDFRSELDGVEPPAPGLDVQVLNYDDSLQLTNNTGETVLVRGYGKEPYVRIAPDGTVEVNTNSPADYLNDDRFGSAPVPDGVEPSAPPEWQLMDRTGQFTWHDHRIHYMGTGTPAQVTDPDVKTKVFDYSVPIEIGGRDAAITGTLYWVGQPGGFPLAPFVALGGIALAVGAGLLIRRRRRHAESTPAREAW